MDSIEEVILSYKENDHSVFQQKLSLKDIMTERIQFRNALLNETVREAFYGVPAIFDALPVIGGADRKSNTATFFGILDRRNKIDMNLSVGSQMDRAAARPLPLSMSIIEYIVTRRQQRMHLICDEKSRQVVGLVTVHDLARLPVRLALFAALLDLEDSVGQTIEKFGGPEANWDRLISNNSVRLLDEFNKSRVKAYGPDGGGSLILEMGFGLKLSILKGISSLGLLGNLRLANTNSLRLLRNDIAHTKPLRNLHSLSQDVQHALFLTRELKQRLQS
ncbi:hypothetical protein [Prosthecomicrobium hirschii]|uniref:hypothetical protein n=1 Tax=Prosthecodimorpha hirschii TaxID=665126 RepID=UPI00128F71C7|nr:hypothetical protein [Prosthecomicrobium hirschii]